MKLKMHEDLESRWFQPNLTTVQTQNCFQRL